MINSMAKAQRLGQTELSSKVYSIRVCGKAMVQCTLRTEAYIEVTLKIMKFKAKALTNGLMGKFMMVAGNSIKWMERACLSGRLEKNTKEASSIEKDKDSGLLRGRTVVATKAIGKTVSNMVKGLSSSQMEVARLGYGERASL